MASGGYLHEDEQALMGLAFNLFILMYQLRTFSEDKELVTALVSCEGFEYFQSLLGVVEIARGAGASVPQHCPTSSVGRTVCERPLRGPFLVLCCRPLKCIATLSTYHTCCEGGMGRLCAI